jgi:methylthioribulose-1-phosphate dehydratase
MRPLGRSRLHFAPMKTLTDAARAALPQRANDIITAAADLARLGWTPATSSNFSMRLDGELIAVTVSGRDKGRLTPADIMVVDLDGRGVETELRPSAETGLHTQIYRRFPEIGCVLHTHSHTQTVASRLFAKDGHIRLSGYELLKAFRGNATHELDVDIPVLPNSQDMDALAAQIEPLLGQPNLYGYLIDGHGVYAWGRDLAEARRHLDALEFLLACELELRKF